MSALLARLEKLERSVGQLAAQVEALEIHGGLAVGLDESLACIGGVDYARADDEDVLAFRQRMASIAMAQRVRLVLGGLPDLPMDFDVVEPDAPSGSTITRMISDAH